MPLKDEVINKIEESQKSSYTKSEVISIVHSIRNRCETSAVKKGDVLTQHVAGKLRPCVVFKISEGLVYTIPLSTTEDELNLAPYSSRFFGDGFFSKSIHLLKKENACKYVIGVLDSNAQLNEAIRQIRKFYSKI